MDRSRPGWPCHTLVAALPRCTTLRQFLRDPGRFSWHGLPARGPVTARMGVPHLGCGSAALYYSSPVSSRPGTIFVARASSPWTGHGQDGRATLRLRFCRAVLLFASFFAARDDFRGTGFQPVKRSRPGWACHTLVGALPRCASVVNLFFSSCTRCPTCPEKPPDAGRAAGPESGPCATPASARLQGTCPRPGPGAANGRAWRCAPATFPLSGY